MTPRTLPPSEPTHASGHPQTGIQEPPDVSNQHSSDTPLHRKTVSGGVWSRRASTTSAQSEANWSSWTSHHTRVLAHLAPFPMRRLQPARTALAWRDTERRALQEPGAMRRPTKHEQSTCNSRRETFHSPVREPVGYPSVPRSNRHRTRPTAPFTTLFATGAGTKARWRTQRRTGVLSVHRLPLCRYTGLSLSSFDVLPLHKQAADRGYRSAA